MLRLNQELIWLILKEVYFHLHWCISTIKENKVHTFMLAFSSPFMCVLYGIYWFFPPLGVTQANDHMTGHPWGLTSIKATAKLQNRGWVVCCNQMSKCLDYSLHFINTFKLFFNALLTLIDGMINGLNIDEQLECTLGTNNTDRLVFLYKTRLL